MNLLRTARRASTPLLALVITIGLRPDPHAGGWGRHALAEDAPAAPRNPNDAMAKDATAKDAMAEAARALEAGDAERALTLLAPYFEGAEATVDPDLAHLLGQARMQAGTPRAALAPFEAAQRRRGSPLDRVAYAEALLAVAKEAIAAGPRYGFEVTPYLRDAIAVLAPLSEAGASQADAALTTAAARVEGEARWLLGDLEGARRLLSTAGLRGDRYATDLRARASFLLGDYSAAALAYDEAGHVRGAAWSRIFAKDPAALPAYLALVTASPGDETLADEAALAATTLSGVDELDAGLRDAAQAEADAERRAGLARARGRILERAGRFREATERYREARALAPTAPGLLADFARARLASAPDDPDAVDEAVAVYEEVLARDPEDAWARSGLAYVAQRDSEEAARAWPDRRRIDRAVKAFAVIAAADPSDGAAWGNLGLALRLAGDEDGAEAAFARSLEANPYDARTWNDLGIARSGAGKHAAALEAFAKALELEPGQTSAHQNAARLRRLAGDLEAATAHTARALATTRAIGGHAPLYRALLDRVWRARARGATPPR